MREIRNWSFYHVILDKWQLKFSIWSAGRVKIYISPSADCSQTVNNIKQNRSITSGIPNTNNIRQVFVCRCQSLWRNYQNFYRSEDASGAPAMWSLVKVTQKWSLMAKLTIHFSFRKLVLEGQGVSYQDEQLQRKLVCSGGEKCSHLTFSWSANRNKIPQLSLLCILLPDFT